MSDTMIMFDSLRNRFNIMDNVDIIVLRRLIIPIFGQHKRYLLGIVKLKHLSEFMNSS